ncbi:hypothetical protein SAMN05660860_00095 [Geoalkalibacter ferrihydriticus]|uniref:Uncharacterized protein n=1 Tax=Geoalkalibacter ferrihydriticus TaxID=392333 RepID=A0A1G9ICM5_9BACT|nr:hypothetical protein [Geoalkalibacter ferrihydriticus]SDL22957.1 hypothetical protein SAMN05660860_00095 [Geoalkalibacter ferrihydriticus]
MFQIVDQQINVEFPLGHHLHCLIAQIPNSLGLSSFACKLTDPQPQWERIRSILELAAEGPGNLKKLHFLMLPESSMPAAHVGEALTFIDRHFRPNTITMFGVEHIRLHEYRALLEDYRADNQEVLASVLKDSDAGDIEQLPVNWAVIAVKETDGRLRVFLQAKSHPMVAEETIDPFHDLYRGKAFPLLRCTPVGFNFMAMICLDYIYRDLYQSNINTVIERANDLFFRTRQRLDLLAVLQCNPKPEHQAFRDVVNGFYGEYLAYTPGVRDTVTVFANTSNETSGLSVKGDYSFGHSSVIIHKSHKILPVSYPEFASDDFDGLPVCRLRFGADTRLYYVNLPLFHELDPRTTRFPLKVHGIYRLAGKLGWTRLEDTDLQPLGDIREKAAACPLTPAPNGTK